MRRSVLAALLAALLMSSFGVITAWLWIRNQPKIAAEPTSPPGPPSSDSAKTIALEWFEHLQEGQIDRTQMTTVFNEALTDDAVKEMSRFLKSYGPAAGDEIGQSRTIQDQTFYLVKFFLQRGDALTMLIGFDENGKVTGLTFTSMGRE
jgi:hypothetical protein